MVQTVTFKLSPFGTAHEGKVNTTCFTKVVSSGSHLTIGQINACFFSSGGKSSVIGSDSETGTTFPFGMAPSGIYRLIPVSGMVIFAPSELTRHDAISQLTESARDILFPDPSCKVCILCPVQKEQKTNRQTNKQTIKQLNKQKQKQNKKNKNKQRMKETSK